MLTATCHCGAVSVDAPEAPTKLTSCNCLVCRRYGTLWAYYNAVDVKVNAAPGAASGYLWGDKSLRFVRCNTCGCVTHWEPVQPTETSHMAVNARNFDPAVIASLPIRRFDGADTWTYLE